MLNKKGQAYGENYLNIFLVSAGFFLTWGIIGVMEFSSHGISEILNMMLENSDNAFWVRLILPLIFFSSVFFYIMYLKGNLND